jgi:hypothetical protein
MRTLTPLTRLQLDRVIDAVERRADLEAGIADKLRADPDKAHFAWRFENAALWWDQFRGALMLGEDGLSADQRFALGYLVSELRIRRRKSEAVA